MTPQLDWYAQLLDPDGTLFDLYAPLPEQ